LRVGAEEDGGERGGEAKREVWRRGLWVVWAEESQPSAEGSSMFAIGIGGVVGEVWWW
jgi:hypothetical protein